MSIEYAPLYHLDEELYKYSINQDIQKTINATLFNDLWKDHFA